MNYTFIRNVLNYRLRDFTEIQFSCSRHMLLVYIDIFHNDVGRGYTLNATPHGTICNDLHCELSLRMNCFSAFDVITKRVYKPEGLSVICLSFYTEQYFV
jgi:hypothetical protein